MNLKFDIMQTPEAERVKAIIAKSHQANLEIQNRRLEYQIHAAAKEEGKSYCLNFQRERRLFRNN